MPTKWYESNKKLFSDEQSSFADNHPFLKLEITAPGTSINKAFTLRTEAALVSGIYRLMIPDLRRYYDYRIAIVLSDNHPQSPPVMYCNDKKLPIGEIDRHIMKDGQACLGVQAEISQKWRFNPRLASFMEDIVAPFLVWQVYYDAHGQPPPWGQRSHDKEGVLEFYAELLGISVNTNVEAFMKLLARKNHPKGHEECPCGSARRLRDCHYDIIQQVREQVDRKDARYDLSIIEQGTGKNN